MRRNGLFAPWETWRKIAGVAMAIFVVILVVAMSLPLGVAAAGSLYLAAVIWKNPLGMPDFDRVQYTQRTRAHRVALFMMKVKNNAPQLFSPVVALGAGPPREDPDHVVFKDGVEMPLQPGFWPPFRLAAWWAALFGLCMAPLEIAVDAVRAPVWGFHIPWPIMMVLSFVGWYALCQIITDVWRISPDKDSPLATSQAPATMLNMVKNHLELRPSILRAASFATIPVGVILVLWAVIKWPWWVSAISIPLSALLTAAALWSRNLTTAYRAEWAAREARQAEWDGIWASLLPTSVSPPMFMGEIDLPTVEEFNQRLEQWEAQHADSDDLDAMPPEYQPLVKCAAFAYGPGTTFEKIAEYAEGLRGACGASLLAIVPFGEANAMGIETPGTVSAQYFRVYYADQGTQLPRMLDPEADPWALLLNIEARVVTPISNLRGIGRVISVRHYLVTEPNSPEQIIGVRLMPRNPGVNIEDFLERLEDIQRAANVRWARVIHGSDEREIILYLGDEPHMETTKFRRPASQEHNIIDQMNWLYYFHANNLRGASGTPRLVRREATTPVVDKLTFSLPPGLPMKQVKAAQEALATASGNEFIEIALNNPDEKPPTTMRERLARSRRPSSGTQFSIIAAKENPLRRVFNFTDYADQIMPGREKGVARINWVAGVLSDDTLAWDDWGNADNPHLLVAGASGSGKSVAMSSMILQIAYNNGPGEARFWMIEPKNEMQIYRDLDVVERFVDSWSPDHNFVKNAADLMEDAVAEMQRRNEIFVKHPKQPKQLRKAREIAIRECEEQGIPLEQHPLYMPYLFVIVEECASLFAGVSPHERDDQLRFISMATEIARKARSSGIHLIMATQYPTKESLSSTIKNQMRSIGFKCQTEVASRVVINQAGLEEINIKGAGMLRVDGEMRLFRGFWVQDGDPDYGEQNDIVETLRKLPSNNGQASALRDMGQTPRVSMPPVADSAFRVWDMSPFGGQRQKVLVTLPEAMYDPDEIKAEETVDA